MASWADNCGNCREPLPQRGNKMRRVPRLGGRRRLVCRSCAQTIDRQATLDDVGKADPREGQVPF